MSVRPVAIGVGVLAIVLAGIGVALFSGSSEPVDPVEPSAAVSAEVIAPAEEPPAEIPPSRRHIKMSNVRMLQAPEKRDFSKVSAPQKAEPTDEVQ